MKNEQQDQNNEYLFRAILELKDMEECRAFFETLCTRQELRSFAQRILVAKMLDEGCVYNHIVQETGASTATISRVNRSMSMGENGYEAVFDRLKAK
ncbi:MAG: TrpR-like protein, YerC/YecD [Clostridia bacterium]|nr:TrpR-like protein, YerC/YecD [Clostridia bacterium]